MLVMDFQTFLVGRLIRVGHRFFSLEFFVTRDAKNILFRNSCRDAQFFYTLCGYSGPHCR